MDRAREPSHESTMSWQSAPEEVDDIGAQLGGILPTSANLDHDEAMYKQLLDMVDIAALDGADGEDDDDDLSTVGGDDDSERQSEHGTLTGLGIRDTVVAITDQQVLDLFVVFGKPFAVGSDFLLTGFIVSALQGSFMGFACLGFFNFFDWTSRTWLGCWEENEGPTGSGYLHGMETGTAPAMLGTGKLWWVAVTTGAGFCIGCFKLIPFVNFPVKPKGIFSEVKDMHVEWKESIGVVVASCLSLAAGASVGPEMAMGSLGGGLGAFIAYMRNLNQEETYSSVLTGMAAAMGPLLPSPVLSVMLLHELSVMAGKAPKHFMETVVSTGIASTTSWFVYFYFADKTFLSVAQVPISLFDVEMNVTPYKQEWLAESVLFGVIGGLLGLVILVVMGVFRTLGQRVIMRLGYRKGTVVLPTVGGLVIGLIGVAFPLTFGDGSLQLSHLVSSRELLGRDYLIGTLFMKIVTLAVSLGFGFIGGQIFPCIFIGACAGCIATTVSNVPIIVTVPCFMAAVPGAFCPIPFTLVGIVALSFALGSDLTTLVFTSTFCAFMTACGTGVIQRMVCERESEGDTQVHRFASVSLTCLH